MDSSFLIADGASSQGDIMAGNTDIPVTAPPASSQIAFTQNDNLTLGVEIELQIIDRKTLDLSPAAAELLMALDGLPTVKPEFYLSTIEMNTGICEDFHEVSADLAATLGKLRPVAAALDVGFATTGAHPTSRYEDCLISPTTRYQAL